MRWIVNIWNYLYSNFPGLLSLILPIIYTLLALLYLAKDWKAHKASSRRIAVSILIVSSGILGIINNYSGYSIDSTSGCPVWLSLPPTMHL